MAKKGSSKHWVQKHQKDYYVNKAKAEGYRSRAVYKLLEIIQKKHFIQAGDKVLDLGAAPGGWSQVARQFVEAKGQVIASDILPMTPINGVIFIQGDFRQGTTYNRILSCISPNQFNVVLSDMAPNMSGHTSVDIPKAMYLAELALDTASKSLVKTGCFCTKLFQGEGFDTYLKQCRQHFLSVSIIKPKASKIRNKEVYLFAAHLNPR